MAVRPLTLSAIFVALAVALGFALMHLPNVELITLVVFMSGFLLGAGRGGFIGCCAMSLFTVFHPLGIPLPPVAVAQVAGMTVIGCSGGLVHSWMSGEAIWAKLAVAGFLATLFYDLITNAAMALALGLISQMATVLVAGLAFSLLHLISNAIIFSLAGPAIIRIGPRLTKNNCPR